MTIDLNIREELERRALIDKEHSAILLIGSFARGWHHATSDIDLVVINEAASGPGVDRPLAEKATTETFHVGDRRWEVRYWLDFEVRQVISKVSWPEFEKHPSLQLLSHAEMLFLERLFHAIAISGDGWLEQTRKSLQKSAFRATAVLGALTKADGKTEDAVGLMESGDVEAAVMSAHLAFGYMVDALTSSNNEMGQEPKWRARRVRLVAHELLPIERFWEMQTMRHLDASWPGRWVESALRTCRELALAVEIH